MSALTPSSMSPLNPSLESAVIAQDDVQLQASFPLRTEWLTADSLRFFVKRAIDLSRSVGGSDAADARDARDRTCSFVLIQMALSCFASCGEVVADDCSGY